MSDDDLTCSACGGALRIAHEDSNALLRALLRDDPEAIQPGDTPAESVARLVSTLRAALTRAEEQRDAARTLLDGTARALARAEERAAQAERERPQTCPMAGQCHGSLCWCDICGDVRMVCADAKCDVHRERWTEPLTARQADLETIVRTLQSDLRLAHGRADSNEAARDAALRDLATAKQTADEEYETLRRAYRRLEEALSADDPRCLHCGKPATCFGRYEEMTQDEFACDDCCGHACEDGHCVQIGATALRRDLATARARLDDCRDSRDYWEQRAREAESGLADARATLTAQAWGWACVATGLEAQQGALADGWQKISGRRDCWRVRAESAEAERDTARAERDAARAEAPHAACRREMRAAEAAIARADRAEADAAALRVAVEAAPHGGELSSFAPGACATLRGLPCDCWKARALAASPAPTTEEP